MHRINPIVEDYKLLLVFKNMGQQLLQELKSELSSAAFQLFFKDVTFTHHAELSFTYLQLSFQTRIEIFFNHSHVPRSAVLATYWFPERKAEEPVEIISYRVDLDFSVNTIYTLNDFAHYYLVEFHQNLKKTFSDTHIPFPIRIK